MPPSPRRPLSDRLKEPAGDNGHGGAHAKGDESEQEAVDHRSISEVTVPAAVRAGVQSTTGVASLCGFFVFFRGVVAIELGDLVRDFLANDGLQLLFRPPVNLFFRPCAIASEMVARGLSFIVILEQGMFAGECLGIVPGHARGVGAILRNAADQWRRQLPDAAA